MTCYRCTAPGAEPVVVTRDAIEVAAGALCDSCFADASEEAAMLREEFEGLIAAGVSREEADRLMICKIDGKGARA